MALILKTLRTNPDMSSDDVDDNFDATAEAVSELQTQMAFGAVYPVAAAVDDDGLTITLSNGNTIGPIAITPTLPRVLGDWVAGMAYKKADTVTYPGGTLQVLVDHVSSDIDEDILAGNLRVLAANGNDATSLDHQRFQALGTVTGGSRIVGIYVVPQACQLQAARPVAGAIATPISGGGSAFDVIVRKVTAAGVSTDLGTLTFANGAPADIAAIDASFAQYDALVLYQDGGDTSTGGGDLAITVTLVPAV